MSKWICSIDQTWNIPFITTTQVMGSTKYCRSVKGNRALARIICLETACNSSDIGHGALAWGHSYLSWPDRVDYQRVEKFTLEREWRGGITREPSVWWWSRGVAFIPSEGIHSSLFLTGTIKHRSFCSTKLQKTEVLYNEFNFEFSGSSLQWFLKRRNQENTFS